MQSPIFSSKVYYALILLLLIPILFKVVDFVAALIRKRNSSPLVAFLAGVVKALIVIVILLQVMNLFQILNGLAERILMSSSLVVVVLGFVFQEGLTNIVHGFILSVSRPFEIGDRVMVMIDGSTLTGYVRTMGLRSTTIQNVENNALVIVPNSKLDLALIQNNYMDSEKSSSAFLDLSVTYESDLEQAVGLVRRCIAENPYVAEEMKRTAETNQPMVLVRDLGESGISLRGIVKTRTVEENFIACSEIRRAIKAAVDNSTDVRFAYPHVQVISGEEKKLQR